MLRKCIRFRRFLKIYAFFVILFLILLYVKFFVLKDNYVNWESMDKYEKEIREYESKIIVGLGAEGKAAYLTGEDKELGQLALKTVALNTILSDRVPLDRTLSDPRHPQCKKIHYDVHKNASVILIFHEEPFSVVLRTVWSIINRTPHHLLHEIILVDDYSIKTGPLGKRLERYLKTRLENYPVKLIRSKSRLGLIRARLAGARVATGDVLVFLDAHCETTIDWLEPLVDRIEKDRTTVAIPIIDVIEADTLTYSTNGLSFQVGGFTWSGHFTWIDVQASETDQRKSPVDPVKSPTMAGGLFAIDRSYFWESGSYDEQMDGWGGENLELSFRIWQCGGRLEQVPCSRVGHIFREFHPYQFPNGKDTHAINTARLALVWMDEYADLYFLHQNKYQHSKAIGDITHRKQLRKKLRCKSFDWYLKNVYPEKFIPTINVKAYGQVVTESNLCFDNLQLSDDAVGPLGIYPCHPMTTPTQLFSLSENDELRQEEQCAEVTTKSTIQLAKCHGHKGSQEWVFEKGLMRNPSSGLCMSAEDVVTEPIVAVTCDRMNRFQIWVFRYVKSD